jgi:hypothetical protein
MGGFIVELANESLASESETINAAIGRDFLDFFAGAHSIIIIQAACKVPVLSALFRVAFAKVNAMDGKI